MTAAWRGPLACLALAGLVTGCTSGSDPQPAQESATGLSHEEQMQDMADDYGITAPPEVDVVREITPDESVTVTTTRASGNSGLSVADGASLWMRSTSV